MEVVGYAIATVVALVAVRLLVVRLASRLAGALPVTAADAAELDDIGRRLLAEHHDRTRGPLCSALERLRARGVPLARVRSLGVRGQAALEFRDGTVILARSRARDDLVVVALAALRGRVLVQAWRDQGAEHDLTLTWATGARSVEAVGLDALSG